MDKQNQIASLNGALSHLHDLTMDTRAEKLAVDVVLLSIEYLRDSIEEKGAGAL